MPRNRSGSTPRGGRAAMSRPASLSLILDFDLVLRQVDDGVILVDFDEHLFAVVRDLITADLADHRFLAILQGCRRTDSTFRSSCPSSSSSPRHPSPSRVAQVKHPVIDQTQVAVVARRDRQRQDAVLQPFLINRDDDGLFRRSFVFLSSGLAFLSSGLSFFSVRSGLPRRCAARAAVRCALASVTRYTRSMSR